MDKIKNFAEEYLRGLHVQKTETTGPGTKKFGGIAKAVVLKPKFARFKLFCQYYNGNANYFSYDYVYEYPGGVKTKRYSEMTGLYDMVERMMKKIATDYRYMTIFANITNNLSTDTGDYGFYVGKIIRGHLTWTQTLTWLDNGRKLDTTGYTCRDKNIPIVKKQFPK